MSSPLTYDLSIGSALSSSVDNTFRALRKKTEAVSQSLGGLEIGTTLTNSIDKNFQSLEKKKNKLTELLSIVPMGEGLAAGIDSVFNNAQEKAVGTSAFIRGIGNDLSQIKSVFKKDKTDKNTPADMVPDNPADRSKQLVTDFKSSMGELQTSLDIETPEHFKEIGNDLIVLSSRMPVAAKGMGKMIKVAEGVTRAKEKFDTLKGSVTSLGEKFGITGQMAKSSMMDMLPSPGVLGKKMEGFLPNVQSDAIKGVGSDLSKIISVFKKKPKDEEPSTEKPPETPEEKSQQLVTDFKSVMGEFQTTMNFETPEHFKEIGNDLIVLSSRMPKTAKGMGKMMKVAGGATEAKKRFDSLKESVASLGARFGITGASAKSALLDTFPSLGPLSDKMGSLLNPLQEGWAQAKEMAGAASETWKSASEGYSFLRKHITQAHIDWVRNKAVMGATIVKTKAAAAHTWLLGTAQRAAALASRAWASVQWALNAAMMANPIGVIVAGAMALGAVAFTVYKYWKPILGFFKGLWKTMGKAIRGAIAGIQKMTGPIKLIFSCAMPLGALALTIRKSWKPILGFFKKLWDTIGKIITGIISGINKIPFIGNLFSTEKKASPGETIEKLPENVVHFSKIQKTAGKKDLTIAPPIAKDIPVRSIETKNERQSVTISFGDIHITATDGKIDVDSLKMQIEETIQEITWRSNERRYSDVA